VAPYFLETVRAQLEKNYDAKTVYEGGLTITTGIDVGVAARGQSRARCASAHARQGPGLPQDPRATCSPNSDRSTRSAIPRWTRDLIPGDVVPALVMSLDAGVIRVRVARNFGTIAKTGYAWTKKRAEDLVKPGDLIEVKIGKSTAAGVFDADLEQPPVLEGAVIAIDNHTGQNPRDGRWVELRSVAVQPRDSGQASGRLAVQAIRVYGRQSTRATPPPRCWRT
jgi:penicillin-binding protein 1A